MDPLFCVTMRGVKAVCVRSMFATCDLQLDATARAKVTFRSVQKLATNTAISGRSRNDKRSDTTEATRAMQHLKTVNGNHAQNVPAVLSDEDSIVRIRADGGNARRERSGIGRVTQLSHERSNFWDVEGSEAPDSHK
jgi:hypothetical protein